MIYKTTSKKYKEMIAALSKIAGKNFDPADPRAVVTTVNRAGRLVWKLIWTLEVRNETMKAKGPGVWRFRLQVDPVLKVNKKSAKIDLATIPAENHESAKKHLEMIHLTGPYFKGASATNLNSFENGKEFLWKQVEHWQKYYSTVKRLSKEHFYETMENECPSAFKNLIQNQK